MGDGGIFENVLLSKMVVAMLRNALGGDKETGDVLSKLGTTEDLVANMIIDTMSPPRGTLSTKECIDVLSGKYCDRFNPSMCVVYHMGKTIVSGTRNNVHCGRPSQNENVCSLCINTTEGRNVSNKMRCGVFNAADYRKAKTTARINLAKNRLRNSCVDHYYVNGKLFVCEEGNMYYSPELDLCVRKTAVDTACKSITVGSGREGKVKLSYTALLKLKGIGVTVDVDSLSPECMEIVKGKMKKSG